MLSKPTCNTAWATGSQAKLREPLASQSEQGWTLKDAPASSVVNYWMNAVHQQLSYASQCIDAVQVKISEQNRQLSGHQTQLDTCEKRVTELEHLVKALMKSMPLPVEPPPKFDKEERTKPIHVPPKANPDPAPIPVKTTNEGEK